ncbi:unnamed protein product [Cyprideis torosa]|uniref:Uncharacterized protein n=1 Tax=Cyprideis torosa TaxID=163714 RepID=A0A7R8ZPW6_9CRUS|nr:unnamed protein product [Cyprideis torosa]CAG0899887.1 unnamed protein product [Cyprideis torosa]
MKPTISLIVAFAVLSVVSSELRFAETWKGNQYFSNLAHKLALIVGPKVAEVSRRELSRDLVDDIIYDADRLVQELMLIFGESFNAVEDILVDHEEELTSIINDLLEHLGFPEGITLEELITSAFVEECQAPLN